jgi:hypothetical protein
MKENPYTTNNERLLAAASNADGQTPVNIYADPTTHELLVKASLNITGLGLATSDKQPNVVGTWNYYSGTNGTVNVTGRVLQITAIALGAAGSFTIDGGSAITLAYNGTDKTSSSIAVEPKGNLVNPTIIFDSGVDSYFIEVVT